MINVSVIEGIFWEERTEKDISVYLKGYIYSHTIDEIIEALKYLDKESIKTFVNLLDGHFELIVQKNNFSFIAVDKIRSTPLFFAKINNKFYVDCDPKKIVNRDNFEKDIREDSMLEISMSGYTIGNKTIFKGLNSLKSGELVIFANNDFKYIQYYKYFGEIDYKKYENYVQELSYVTLGVFRKLLDNIGNKQIIIPLSAGNDSRLVASMFKHLGAKNVKCYSYGSTGSFEAGAAKIVAEKLGYEWIFVPLTYKGEKEYYRSNKYQEYLEFSETFCSIPYTQGLSTIRYLKDINWIEEDAIFINGNSGDFISGAHINDLMIKNTKGMTKEIRKENILDNLIKKHFSLWEYLKTDKNIKYIKKNLWHEISAACGGLGKKEKDHMFYEYSELIDRQSSYVVTGQKVYEFYKHEWRLPLWDDDYLYFWQKVPAELKVNQRLYMDMLKSENFGNVWGDNIPVNKKNITPKWVIPLRFFVKAMFGMFGRYGKKVWHKFERNAFQYFMDTNKSNVTTPYKQVLFDRRGQRNSVSWLSEEYIKKIYTLFNRL